MAKSAIQEVRDQLFLDTADGKYLSHVSANLGVIRPMFGFSDDDIWRAIVRRIAADYRQIENVFHDIMTIILGPQKTVGTVLSASTVVGDEELTVATPLAIPQRGTMVLDEGLATEETVEYSFRDPSTGVVTLKSALTFGHTAPTQEAVSNLFLDAASTATVLQFEDTVVFPSVGVLLVAAGKSVEEVVELLSNNTTLAQLTIAGPGLAFDQLGPTFSFLMSTVDSIGPNNQVVFLDDSSQFPDEGLIHIQEDVPAGSKEVVRYVSNDKTTGMLQLATELNLLYAIPSTTVTLMRDGATVQLAQVQVKGIGWDVLSTSEDNILHIYIPEQLDRNRLLDASFFHDAIAANPATVLTAAGATAGDTTLLVVDSETFPLAGKLLINAVESIGYSRIDRYFASMNGSHGLGLTTLYVDDVTGIKAAFDADLTVELIIGRGTGSEEPADIVSIDPVANTIEIAAGLVNNHIFGPALGSITTVAGASLVDATDTFTIDDGIHPPVVFEFDSNGVITPGNIAVPFTGGDTADDVRDTIITVINNVPKELLTVSASDGGAATVDLQSDLIGAVGNNPITETVAAGGFAVAGMVGGLNGGSVEILDPRVLFLNTPLQNTYGAGLAVILDEDEYAGTDLEIGDPTVAPADRFRFQGPYLYYFFDRAPEETKTVLDENVAGPTRLLVTQRPGGTVLEVENASFFRTAGEFDVRVFKGIGVGETLDVTTVITEKAVRAAAVTTTGTALGSNVLDVNATANLPNGSGYRLIVDQGGANEEIVWVTGVLSGTQLSVFPPTAKVHAGAEVVETVSDVVVLSEPLIYEHVGLIPYAEKLNIFPGNFEEDRKVNQVEEIRTYIDVVDASLFTADGSYAIANFGREVAPLERRMIQTEVPGSGTLILDDTSEFPVAGYPYQISVSIGASRERPADSFPREYLLVTNNNVGTNTFTISPVMDFGHVIGDLVRYEPGEQEAIVYVSTDTAPDPDERLNFPSGVRFQNQHLKGEPITLSGRVSRPSTRGFDYPFYLPSSWEERLKYLFDKVRAAGVQVIITNDR